MSSTLLPAPLKTLTRTEADFALASTRPRFVWNVSVCAICWSARIDADRRLLDRERRRAAGAERELDLLGKHRRVGDADVALPLRAEAGQVADGRNDDRRRRRSGERTGADRRGEADRDRDGRLR